MSLMDHLLAADVLLGEQAALPIVAGGSYSYIASNVFYVATRIVDKLWQGNRGLMCPFNNENRITGVILSFKILRYSCKLDKNENYKHIFRCLF